MNARSASVTSRPRCFNFTCMAGRVQKEGLERKPDFTFFLQLFTLTRRHGGSAVLAAAGSPPDRSNWS